jgi:hypothetical protein
MERYYRILGISNNASKDEIKKAYHEKMKALHPDKVHGTPLEDTATFFTSEINEAYNILMSQSVDKNSSSNHKNQREYMEEEIYVENVGLLKYSLSNDLVVIVNAVADRAGYIIDDPINTVVWVLNTKLSENVKEAMIKHSMNYSMTIVSEGSVKIVMINRRMGNNWYITAYEVNLENGGEEKSTHYNNINEKQYKPKPDIPSEKSNAKTGFFIGLLNLLHLIIVYMNKHNINLPEDKGAMIIFAWGIITLVLAITGFFVSRKGYVEERKNSGYGIAGMALNGLVILPALLLLLSTIFSSKNNRK